MADELPKQPPWGPFEPPRREAAPVRPSPIIIRGRPWAEALGLIQAIQDSMQNQVSEERLKALGVPSAFQMIQHALFQLALRDAVANLTPVNIPAGPRNAPSSWSELEKVLGKEAVDKIRSA